MTENRRYHRMEIQLPVSFETEDPKHFYLSNTINISPTGMALRLTEPVKKGQFLTMSITIEDNKTAKVDAQVIWVRERVINDGSQYMAGVKIIDKMDRDEIEFVRFIAKKMMEHFKTLE